MLAGLDLALTIAGFLIYLLAAAGKFSIQNAPLVFGFFFAYVLDTNFNLPELIPGHPYITFFVYAAIIEAVLFGLVMIPSISRSVIVLSCCLLSGILLQWTVEAFIKPDSIQYCIMVTVIFAVIALLIVWGNIRAFDRSVGSIIGNIATDIAAGCFYGISIATLFWYDVNSVWKAYYESIGFGWSSITDTLNVISIVIFAAVAALVVIRGILLTVSGTRARAAIDETVRLQRDGYYHKGETPKRY